jgi:hypothetical protein
MQSFALFVLLLQTVHLRHPPHNELFYTIGEKCRRTDGCRLTPSTKAGAENKRRMPDFVQCAENEEEGLVHHTWPEGVAAYVTVFCVLEESGHVRILWRLCSLRLL